MRYLKWLTLGALLRRRRVLIEVPWAAVLHELVLPRLAFTHDTMIIVAVFGTTIYLFFGGGRNRTGVRRSQPRRQCDRPDDIVRAAAIQRRPQATAPHSLGHHVGGLQQSPSSLSQHRGRCHASPDRPPRRPRAAARAQGAARVPAVQSRIINGLRAVPVLASSASPSPDQLARGLDLKLGEAPKFTGWSRSRCGRHGARLRIVHPRTAWSAVINSVIAVPIKS
jgi:hypothetical protein